MTEIMPEGTDRWTPEKMVEVMKQYFELPLDFDYYLILEFSILSRLRGHIPNDICGYLLIHGPSGTGKSHVGQFITEMSCGDWVQAISEGALLAGVSSGKMIGLDEVDGNIKRVESLEDILRVGRTWDAKYRKMIPTKDGFRDSDIICGGPKVLTCIGNLEPALMSRCYTIEMTRSTKAHEFSVKWLYRKDDVLKIAHSLDLFAEEIKKTVDGDNLKDWHLSLAHLEMLHKLHNVHARRTDLANVFTTIDHLLGWNVQGIIESLGKEAIDEEKEALNGYLRELVDIERQRGRDVENDGIIATRILEYVNQRRREAGQRPFNSRSLGKAMTELGFTEKENKVRRSDGIYYLFNTATQQKLDEVAIDEKEVQEQAKYVLSIGAGGRI